MIVDHILPVFLMIGLGFALRRLRMIEEPFLRTTDKLVYYVMFPALLFWKIGGAPPGPNDAYLLYGAVGAATLVTFVSSTAVIAAGMIPASKAGAFSQSCYRFNSYIGLALVIGLLGDSGVSAFGRVMALAIPLNNVLSVLVLTWYADRQHRLGSRLRFALVSTLTNPLIIACAAGILYAMISGRFAPPAANFLRLLTYASLPLALISVGGALQPALVKNHLWHCTMAAFFKLMVMPLAGFAFLWMFQVHGDAFRIGMIYFALPISPATYILSTQLGSDPEFAAASVVFSTLVSMGALMVALQMI
jgi:predicted permease